MKTDSIKKNYLYQLLSQIITTITPIIIYPHISRVLGVENLGIYSYVNSILYYFLLIANLGIINYGSREIAKVLNDKKKLSGKFKSIYFTHICSTFVSIFLYIIFIFMFGKKYFILEVYQILQLIAVGLDISWFYSGIQKFKTASLTNSFLKIIMIILTFTFVRTSSDIYIYIIILGIINILSHLVLFINLNKYITNVKVNKCEIIKHMKPLMILCVPSIAISLYKYMDKIMIENLSSVYQLGLYEVAEKVVSIPLGVISAIGLVLLPKFSELISCNKESEIKKLNLMTFKYTFILAIGVTFGIISISNNFIPIFFGNEYNACVVLSQLLSITIIFTTWSNLIRTQYLLPNSYDKQFTVCVSLGAIVNLFLNFILIQLFDAIGAVISTIVAEFVVAIVHIYYAKKSLDIKQYIKNSCFFYIIGGIMFFVIKLIQQFLTNNIISIFIEVFVGASFYLLISGIWLFYTKDEMFLKLINYGREK